MYWKLSQGPFLSVILPPTTVTVTDRHTAHSFHTFILHTPRVETWPVYNWYQRSTTSSFRKSPRQMSFSSLIVHFCVRKKETTGPRVLILILVFIFILFEKNKTSQSCHFDPSVLISRARVLNLFCSSSSGLQVRIHVIFLPYRTFLCQKKRNNWPQSSHFDPSVHFHPV